MVTNLINRFAFRQIITVCLFFCVCLAKADEAYHIQLSQPEPTLCGSQSFTFSANVSSDAGILTSCIYSWYVKKPTTSDFVLLDDNDSSCTIIPTDFGSYAVFVSVTPTESTTPFNSDTITVQLFDDLITPTISGDATICYNTAPNNLEVTTAAQGGAGRYSYQWQQSADGVTFTNITDATNTSLQLGNLTQTTYYQLVTTDIECGSVTSNVVTITVYDDLIAPTISGNATICYNTTPNNLAVTIAAQGGAGRYSYQWQQSADGVTFTNITDATNTSLQLGNLTQTTYYQLVTTDIECGSVTSNVVTITVYDDLKVSVAEKTQPLCFQTKGKIRVNATGAGDKFTYQWQKLNDNSNFVDISGANNVEYEVSGDNAGTFYYRCVVSPIFGCTKKTSDTIPVLVYDDVTAAQIGDNDTICYGFDSKTLSIVKSAQGGDGKFTYRWMQRSIAKTNFEYIAGETFESYTPRNLTGTTEYKLEISNVCKTVYSNTITIVVRERLNPPEISYAGDTICYNTVPNVLRRSVNAKGGSDDSFTYQWQQSADGLTFIDIAGETGDLYAPTALKTNHYYRLRASSEKLCGDIYSNVIAIHVYDSLYAVASTAVSHICYQTSASMSVVARGGGEAYSYQWQQSEDGIDFRDISSATYATYTTNKLSDGVYYYRCVVSTQKCEDVWCMSNHVRVDVYEDLTAGVIAGTDSTCYGYAPTENFYFAEKPTGVDGAYAYQWQKRIVNAQWDDILGATNEQYAPEALTENTEYRVVVSSVCCSKTTNSILVRVNPLPVEQVVSGDNDVCYNQYNIYSIDHLNSGFTYEWSLQSECGKIISSSIDTTAIVVFWEKADSHDEVWLTITDNKTGCERIVAFPITICNEGALDGTIIVRKPSSNILVCKEDRDIFYQWGFTDKASLVETPIDDSNRRYVLLPHTFDSDAYDYWLVTRPSETSKCHTKSVYSPENDTLIVAPVANVSMPTHVHKTLPISIQNPSEEEIICLIYDVGGRCLARYNFGVSAFVETILPLDVVSGLYFVCVEIGAYVETYKLIAK